MIEQEQEGYQRQWWLGDIIPVSGFCRRFDNVALGHRPDGCGVRVVVGRLHASITTLSLCIFSSSSNYLPKVLFKVLFTLLSSSPRSPAPPHLSRHGTSRPHIRIPLHPLLHQVPHRLAHRRPETRRGEAAPDIARWCRGSQRVRGGDKWRCRWEWEEERVREDGRWDRKGYQ